MSGLPWNISDSNFGQLSLSTRECWLKIEWRITKGSLNSFGILFSKKTMVLIKQLQSMVFPQIATIGITSANAPNLSDHRGSAELFFQKTEVLQNF